MLLSLPCFSIFFDFLMSLYISYFFFITSLFFLAAGTCAWAKFCHHKTAETCPHRQQASLVDVSLTSTWTIDPGTTFAALVEESLNQASIQVLSPPFSEWMTKPVLLVDTSTSMQLAVAFWVCTEYSRWWYTQTLASVFAKCLVQLTTQRIHGSSEDCF